MMDEDKMRAVRTLTACIGVAAALLLFAVLPAEFGIDPTGVGRLLGLTRLAPANTAAMLVHKRGLRTDAVDFTLAPYESLELKYVGEKGAALVYEWTAARSLHYDFHGEQEGRNDGGALSFARGEAASRAGQIVLPFAGEHGWFWENRSAGDVELKLVATGFFDERIIYRDGGRYMRTFATLDPQNAGAAP